VKRIASVISACFLVSGLMASPSGFVSAQEGGRIYTSEAQGKTDKPVTITVSPYGMVLSFIEVQESVDKFWTTDYSHLRIGADTPSGKGAKLIFLKTEGELSADTKGTSLTIITKTKTGEPKIYSFLVDFTTAKPTYSILRIYPDKDLRQNSITGSGTVQKSAPISSSPKIQTSQITKPTAVAVAPAPKIEKPSLPQSSVRKTNLFSNPSIQAAQTKTASIPVQTIYTLPPAKAADSVSTDIAPTKVADSTSTDVASAKVANSTSTDVAPAKVADSTSTDVAPTKVADSTSTDVAPTKVADSTSTDVAPAKVADSTGTDVAPAKVADSTSTDVAPAKAADSVSTDTSSSVQNTEIPKSDSAKVVDKDTTLPAEPIQISKSSLPPAASLRSTSLTQANALVRGLAIANRAKEIGYTSPISRSVQNIVRRLRRGESLQNAAPKESIQWKTILRLLQLGKYQGDV
jgi:hypothetical protein